MTRGDEKKKPYAEVAREKTLEALDDKHRKENGERLHQKAEYEKEKSRLEGGGMREFFEKFRKPLID